MDSQTLVSIVYTVILYGSLVYIAIPIVFFLLWTFFDFWKKHIELFYAVTLLLFAATVAGFYYTQHLWIYWYYAFPPVLQMLGLLFILFTYSIGKLAQVSITVQGRYFYALLKGEKTHLKTDGLYKYVRHPIYAMVPFGILGALFYTGQLIFIPILFFNLAARGWYAEQEEKQLKKFWLSHYEAYEKKTPNRFYPKFF